MDPISYSALSLGALVALKTGIVIPLALACLVLIVVLPAAAWRGRLSVPIFALLALVAGAVAFGAGKLAGAQSVHGTPFGIVVSIVFFLLVAGALGCFLGIVFYRYPAVDEPATAEGQGNDDPSQESDRS